jgi:tetratricopeptide (TPR) repeat protein
MKLFACLYLVAVLLAFGACSRKDSSGANNADQDGGPKYTDAVQAMNDGITLLDQGETDEAIDVLNQAVTLNPDLAEAYFHLGIAYALIESRDESVIENDVNANIANVEKDRRDKKKNSEIAFERAITGFKKIVANNKDDHAAWYNMGRSYNKLNKDEDALEAFREAVRINPDDTEYQTALGAILIKLARYREAIAPLKKALEIDPENVEAQEYLEDAEAGRSRVSYSSTPKPDKNANANVNAVNSNSATSNTGTAPPPPANTVKTPLPKPSPVQTPKKPGN